MELRKNPKLDLERKRGMFFGLGLVISMSLVMTAFQWTTEISQVMIFDPPEEGELVYMIEPIATVINPPEPPKAMAKQVVDPVIFISDEEPAIRELIVDEPVVNIDEGIEVLIEPMIEEKVDQTFEIVEQMPTPDGGMNSFYQFLAKNMKYPNLARKVGIEGRVYAQFVIDKDGSLTDIKVIKGIGGGCDEEATRVLAIAPKWKPGKQRGQPVKVRMVVPVYFALN